MSEIKHDFLLGCDPEFAWYSKESGKVISGNTYLQSDANLGVDGNGVTVEVRPEASRSPIKVVNNIRNIFLEHSMRQPKILEIEWLSGSHKYTYPLGGHIHFGTKETKVKLDNSFVVNVLSHYLGSITLLLEGEEGKLRRGNSYGRRTDIREQDYGIEYRTPSSWLSSPYVACGVLSLAKTVMWEILNNPELKDTYYNLFTDEDFSNMNTNKVFNHFPKLWEDITKMELYQKFKVYLDFIYWLVIQKSSWLPKGNGDFKESWGIVNLPKSQKPSYTLDLIFQRYKLSCLQNNT